MALTVLNYLQLVVAHIVGAASDLMHRSGVPPVVFAGAAAVILGLTLIIGVFRFLMRDWIVGASRDIEFEFRNDIFRKLQSLTATFYDQQRTGDLMSRATNDVEAVRMFLGPGILQFFNSVIIFPLAIYRMILISSWITVATMTPLLILPLIVNFFGNRVHRRFRQVQDKYAGLSAMVQENLAGARVVKAFVQEEAQQDLFSTMNHEFVALNMKLARVQSAFFPMIRVLTGVSVVMLLWVGAREVVSHRITVGQLVEFSLIQIMLFWPMIALGWTVSLMQRGAASMERIEEVLELTPDVLSLSDSGATEHVPSGCIEFRNLSFRYAPELPLVLSDISVHVASGKRLGIVGQTGSGKSTLAMLLAHLYRVDRGMLFIDGVDINDIPLAALRDEVSVVFQETFLFSDTVANNIAFGRESADLEEIREMARQSHIHSEIEEFPHGYDTMLGERGINLSGGQKQRSAIARALIRNPRILVLDDALSAVDTETESRIIDSLDRALHGRTSVIVAHRISAVRKCDEIIVLDRGRIVERGCHDELVSAGGLYASLYEKQLLADAVELESD